MSSTFRNFIRDVRNFKIFIMKKQDQVCFLIPDQQEHPTTSWAWAIQLYSTWYWEGHCQFFGFTCEVCRKSPPDNKNAFNHQQLWGQHETRRDNLLVGDLPTWNSTCLRSINFTSSYEPIMGIKVILTMSKYEQIFLCLASLIGLGNWKFICLYTKAYNN